MKKTSLLFNIISIILIIICLLVLSIFSYNLLKLNILPTKYLIIGYSVLILILLSLLTITFSKFNKIVKIASLVLIIIMSFGLFCGTKYLDSTYDFFTNTQTNYDTLTYSIIVAKNSPYSTIDSLKDKNISYLDDYYRQDIKEILSSKIKYNEILTKEFGILPENLMNSVIDAICIEESYLTLIYEEVDGFSDNIKVLDTFEIKVKSHSEQEKNEEILDEPFVLYISGIDKYGKVTTVRGRSDVNQLAVVNPKTNHILLVNTPRDYYVQLAGTTGLKDKLTHAGIYGINKSINTIEELYDINVNNYLRVNFNTLINVVDIIGGIDIYSDSSFRCHTNKKVYVNKGWNHFDGAAALAYSRERYAYIDGDHHRGANQQQVITAILEKVTNSSVIISKYNSILNSLNGTFQTDMPMDNITSFIRYQLDKMPNWNIESIAVTGSNSTNFTYSMGMNYKLYVMEPDYNSVNSAKARINEVLNEN